MTRLKHRGSLTTFKLLRLYQSERGIWHYEIERWGKVYWSSLHTRDEVKARGMYERIKKTLDEWSEAPSAHA